MPVPSPRNKILPARGNYVDLAANIASILDGEICYAIDQDQYYQNEGGALVAVGATKAQGLLADTAVQPGGNVSSLVNDAGYITLDEVPPGGVTSVAGKTGDVTLVKTDITDFSDSDYATAAQGTLANTATQPGDNNSTLTNDAGYITLAEVPPGGVTSVNTQVGDVVLNAADVGAVSTSGDNMTGDLTLGTDNITLDAGDGSASFAGNVGIGTNNPQAKLDVRTGAGTPCSILVNEGTTANPLTITQSSTEARIQTSASQPLVIAGQSGSGSTSDILFETRGATRAVITDAGNVGIGTSSPTSKLHLSSATGSALPIPTELTIGTSTSASDWSITDPWGRISFYSEDSSGGGPKVHASINTIASISNGGSSDLTFNVAGSERLRVNSAGNVGIGTTDPEAKLEVGGEIMAAVGTESAPSFTFTGDSNTGMYRVSSDILGFASGGARKMSINPSNLYVFTAVNPSSSTSGFQITNGGLLRSRSTGGGATVTSAIFGGTLGTLSIKADGDCENTNGRYTQSSDGRIKENIIDASSQWEDIKNLRWVNYNYKPGTNHPGHTQLGVVAQEAELVSPGIVQESDTADVDWDEDLKVEVGDTYKTVAYSLIAMKAAKGLQEAMLRIEALEAQNADLLARIEAIEQA